MPFTGFVLRKCFGRGLQYSVWNIQNYTSVILMCRRKNPPQFCDHSSNFPIIFLAPNLETLNQENHEVRMRLLILNFSPPEPFESTAFLAACSGNRVDELETLGTEKEFDWGWFPLPRMGFNTLILFFVGASILDLELCFMFSSDGDTSKGRRTSLYDFWVKRRWKGAH